MKLENDSSGRSLFEVHLSYDDVFQNITENINSCEIQENIHGDMEGRLSCHDAAGTLDSLIGTNSLIRIKFPYYGNEINVGFYLDGVKNVNFQTGYKEYIIKLTSINNMINSRMYLQKVYKGLSSDILKQLYEDVYGTDPAALKVLSSTETEGKYIAPNINPKTIQKLILLNSYGKGQSPMFLYQKLIDGGVATLESLHDMIDKENFISITDTTTGDEWTSNLGSIGIFESLQVEKSYTDNVKKTNQGYYGKTLNVYDVENTSFKKVIVGEAPQALTTNRIYRKNYYTEKDTPLLHNYEINTDTLGEVGLLNNVELAMLKRTNMFAIKVRTLNMSAVPVLSCGETVGLVIQEIDTGSQHVHNGSYLVAGITHKIIKQEKDFEYTQDLELVRPQ